MHYLSIINDLQIGNKVIDASKIYRTLFENNIWLFTKNAPFMKKINKNDQFILYLAGSQRKIFQNSFIINGEIKKIENSNLVEKIDKEILKFFYYYVPIKEIHDFKNNVKIKDIKENLEFITDKTNYGLFLRQSVKKINKKDYNYILNKQK
jgi:predicted RNA-binding protein